MGVHFCHITGQVQLKLNLKVGTGIWNVPCLGELEQYTQEDVEKCLQEANTHLQERQH